MLKPRAFGRYILIDRISTSGAAEVFLAKATGVEGFEKLVAIKRIVPAACDDPSFAAMFVEEAKLSARLAHSGITQVLEFGQVDGQYYLAMEYVPGKDLRAVQTHLKETDRVMEVSMALHIIGRVCQALDYAHRQKDVSGQLLKIVHRHLSPANVLISFEGAVKLTDFGLAESDGLEGEGAYRAPEAIEGELVDHRADLFCVGLLLYELLTNCCPFAGETQHAVLQAIRQARVAPPSTINPEVALEIDAIVLKALARDPEQRYGWASELRADIERYFARSGAPYDPSQLTQWMQSEFAGDVLADQRLRERVHHIQRAEVAPEVERPAAALRPPSREQVSPVRWPARSTNTGPQVIGPSGKKVRRELVNWPTAFGDENLLEQAPAAEPDQDGDELMDWSAALPRQRPPLADNPGPIVPGPNRDKTTVGGALEVSSRPARGQPSTDGDDLSVAVAGIDGVIQTDKYSPRATRAPAAPRASMAPRATPRVEPSSTRVVLIAAVGTLLLAGIIGAPFLLCSEPTPPVPSGGTMIVTALPAAGCSVSLDGKPRGMLAPGDSFKLSSIPAGAHVIDLACGGFKPYSASVEVRPPDIAVVEARLEQE